MTRAYNLRVWMILFIFIISGFVNINLICESRFTEDTPKYSETISNEGLFDEYLFSLEFELINNNRLGETWDLIKINDCYYHPIPWSPAVPVKPFVFDTEHEVAKVEIFFTNEIKLNPIKIEPAPEPEVLVNPINMDLVDMSTDEDVLNQKITEYLSSDSYYPGYDYLITKLDRIDIDGAVKNKYGMDIFPCKYNPAERTAILYKDVKIRIYYSTETPEPTSAGSRSDEQNTPPSNRDNSGEVEYLILTTNKLMDELEELATWKLRKGLTCKIVDVNLIYQNESFNGYDQPEEIRNYIRFSHENFGTDYVLLAGDYDTVPPRMCHDPNPYEGADDGEIPSDTYYACISEGSTWDVDDDKIYGELGDLDDIYPDIMVGRIAINAEAKMEDWVNEIINYECNPGIENWTNKVILLGPNVHNTGDGAEQSEYFYENYLKYIYSSFDKFYEDSDKGNKPFSKSGIVQSINQGSTFINYLGHGGPTAWTYNFGYNTLLNKGDVSKLKNGGMKPVVYAMSCLTQWFDDPSDSGYGNFGDCIGETFTEDVVDGGIGYIGSARVSVGVINQNYGPFATGLQEEFIRQLSQYNFGLGSAFTEGKKHYAEYWGNYFPDTNSNGEIQACWLEVNLLGEPELTLWTKVPEKFTVINETYENTLKISVENDTGSPIKDALVCIQFGSSKLGGGKDAIMKRYTSSIGEAVFDISGLQEKVNLTISKTNFVPYLELLTIQDRIPPVTSYEVKPNSPDGENDWYVTTPMINLSMNEEGTIYYYWDDNPKEVFTGPISAPEGVHNFSFYSVDISDNIESIQELEFKVDLTKPTCVLELDPEAPNGQHGWYAVQPIINISSEPTAEVFYAFDDELNLSFPGPMRAPVGIHRLHYYSRDEAGNKGETRTIVLKVDITPPNTELQLEPGEPTGDNGWYTSPPKISFNTEVDADTYYYWINDDDKDNTTQFYDKTFSGPEGVNRLYYYSVDYAGCTEKVNIHTLKVDTEPPVATHELSPEIPDGENGFYTNPVFISLHSEPGATILYSWDGSSAKEYNQPITAPEGTHTLTYYSTDDAGNIGEQVNLEVKLDTYAPITEIKLEPSIPTGNNGWYNVIPFIEFETESDATVYYRFEDTFEMLVPDILEMPEGENKIYYYSVDLAGNIGTEDSELIKVDITPPVAKLETEALTYEVNTIITFEIKKSFDLNEIEGYNVDFGDGEESDLVTKTSIKHRYQKPGEYKVTLTVRDIAGNENDGKETLTILIIEKEEPVNPFSLDNLILIITIVIAIFIVLSTLFIAIYRRYKEADERSIGTRGRVSELDLSPAYEVTPVDAGTLGTDLDRTLLSTSTGLKPDPESELAEAIIIKKPVVFKMKKIRCPGCKKTFLSDPESGSIKCPSCGLTGEVPGSSKKAGKSIKFKCPACECIFKTHTSKKEIKCPNCGVKGKL